MIQRVARQPGVLVTDANRGSAVALIRSLGRHAYRVIAADTHRHSLGFRCSCTAETLVYPSPEQAPEEFIAVLLEAAQKHELDLIIPITDAAILPLSASRSRFAGLCRLALPEAGALEEACDKHKTLQLAQRLGVPTPRTHLVETVGQAAALGPSLGWPVVLKPQFSRRYRSGQGVDKFSVCYAENEKQLIDKMQPFENRCPVLLQEYYPGQGHGVEMLLFEGAPLAAFQHVRLRELPIHGGPSALRESVPLDPTLYAHSAALLGALRWTGLAMVEFKVGSAGARLMEINGRIWGSLPLAVQSGMDFPARLADLCLQGPPKLPLVPNTSYKTGVRCRNLELDLAWIATILLGKRPASLLMTPRRRDAIVALAELFNPSYKCDVLSLSDPRPGIAELVKITRKFIHKLRSRK